MPFWGRNDPMPPFWGHEPVPMVDADTAAKAVEAGAALVDVGQPGEWLSGHLPGAVLIEATQFDADIDRIPKDRPVVVASHRAGIAEEVVASLRAKGYDAAALEGGVAAWASSGRPLHRHPTRH